jgi:hypothetical protein
MHDRNARKRRRKEEDTDTTGGRAGEYIKNNPVPSPPRKHKIKILLIFL